MRTFDEAREFAYGQHTKQAWRTALLTALAWFKLAHKRRSAPGVGWNTRKAGVRLRYLGWTGDPLPTTVTAEQLRAACETSGLIVDYLLDHSPYNSLTGVKAAETRVVNKRKKEEADELLAAFPVIQEIIATHSNMQGCYFWTPRGNTAARARWSDERTNYASFTFEGVRHSVSQETNCSAKNIYYTLDVSISNGAGGWIKKDVRRLHKILRAHTPVCVLCLGSTLATPDFPWRPAQGERCGAADHMTNSGGVR